ncbi:MAG: ferritin-like domain-containing protein [Dehalococcoidales bacterium]|nr:ferritin-like domain-containing protein [Dehalococcoidales bacterium]
MSEKGASAELINLLNRSIAREMQVSIQYMLQHSICNAREPDGGAADKEHSKFMKDRSSAWLPGLTLSLKAIAVDEMRHVADVAERIVQLGGEPTTHSDEIAIGKTFREMLEIDREREGQAIDLYRRIISVAEQENDALTLTLFRRILAEEVEHHQVFSKLLATL